MQYSYLKDVIGKSIEANLGAVRNGDGLKWFFVEGVGHGAHKGIG